MPPDSRSSDAPRVVVLIPAAGSGLRLGGGTPKALRLLNGRSLLERSLAAMAAHPKLIERPIVVKGRRAVLGRPPENVLALTD